MDPLTASHITAVPDIPELGIFVCFSSSLNTHQVVALSY